MAEIQGAGTLAKPMQEGGTRFCPLRLVATFAPAVEVAAWPQSVKSQARNGPARTPWPSWTLTDCNRTTRSPSVALRCRLSRVDPRRRKSARLKQNRRRGQNLYVLVKNSASD